LFRDGKQLVSPLTGNVQMKSRSGKKSLWSIRMRASGSSDGQKNCKIHRQSGGIHQKSIHISGAENLCTEKEIGGIVSAYTQRALDHPRGRPIEVVITIERISGAPLMIPLLRVSTLPCDSSQEARTITVTILSRLGISQRATRRGIGVVTGKRTMRGAALILSESGVRVEPDTERGIRVSIFGISDETEKNLSRQLAKSGINSTRVKEALFLASKVASCKGIIAELCVSDDPDYTTGYVASRQLGYVRIPYIKREKCMMGGRVFFIEEKADVKHIIEYLETTPVIIGRFGHPPCLCR
jgi:6-carboxyhexanoate--CoA ligase